MNSLITTVETALWNLTHRIGIGEVVDILTMAVIIYALIMLVRHSRSSSVLKGLVVVGVVTLISEFFGLTALNWLTSSVLKNGALVLIILFQPELRKTLEQVGRGRLIEWGHSNNEEENQMVIDELVQCMKDLSRRKVGMLIVIEKRTGLADVIDTGVRIDGRVSAPLLENIFEPNTPLHDGAVVINGSRVVAGACMLPLTDSNTVSRELGTRHRAALGISEITDALVLVVSEETGTISYAQNGRITRNVDEGSLRILLRTIYPANDKKKKAYVRIGKGAAK